MVTPIDGQRQSEGNRQHGQEYQGDVSLPMGSHAVKGRRPREGVEEAVVEAGDEMGQLRRRDDDHDGGRRPTPEGKGQGFERDDRHAERHPALPVVSGGLNQGEEQQSQSPVDDERVDLDETPK